MSDENEEGEFELLCAMYDCELVRTSAGRVLTVRLVPTSADDLRILTATIEVTLTAEYPAKPPSIRLTTARGMLEREEREVVGAARAACSSSGECCCVDLVQAALFSLTRVAERPGECPCCCEELCPLDSFCAPTCEHCFHGPCLLRWRHSLEAAEPTAAPGGTSSAEDARLRAALADHAQAAARIEAHGAHEASVREALAHVERQLAALAPEARQEASHLDRSARQHRDALAEAAGEAKRLSRAARRLEERAAVEREAAERAAAERARDAALRTLPCPVCRMPIGAAELDALQRECPQVGPRGGPPGRSAAGTGRSRFFSIEELLDPELLARVRALQVEHTRIALAQLARAEQADEAGAKAAAGPTGEACANGHTSTPAARQGAAVSAPPGLASPAASSHGPRGGQRARGGQRRGPWPQPNAR